MEEKFSNIEILDAVKEILKENNDKDDKKKNNSKSELPSDTINIILQAEKHLKK